MTFVPTERDGAVTFEVLVQPRAGKVRIGPIVDDRLKIAVTAAPTDGEANAAVVETLSRALGVAKRQVEILHGQTSRRKRVRVVGASAAQVLGLVQS